MEDFTKEELSKLHAIYNKIWGISKLLRAVNETRNEIENEISEICGGELSGDNVMSLLRASTETNDHVIPPRSIDYYCLDCGENSHPFEDFREDMRNAKKIVSEYLKEAK